MPENILAGLIGAGLIGLLIFQILRMVFKKYSISLTCIQKYSLKDIFSWMFKNSEMRKRILITVGILIILRLAFLIPLPGVDRTALKAFLSKMSTVGTFGMFIGGVRNQMRIFGLGLTTFFSSCLLIQLGSVFIPVLRRFSFGGERGRERISKYTYILTIILSVIQVYFLSMWLENLYVFGRVPIVSNPGLGFRLVTIATMTGAVMLLLFIASIINQYGIGNGVAVIAVSSIPLGIVSACYQTFIDARIKAMPAFFPLLAVVLFVGFIYGIFYVTRMAKIIEIKHESLEKNSIYFRPTIVGREPIGWGIGLLLLPVTIASFVNANWTHKFSTLFMEGSLVYIIIVPILIFLFTFLYSLIVFKTRYVGSLMGKYGYSLSDNTEESISEFLKHSMSKVLIITALFLIGINLIPNLASFLLKIPYSASGLIFGAGIVMTVGVFSDIVRQLEFFKDREASGINEWSICYIAFDGIEAKIKKGYLENKGITALVEPLRFTWGMPIRTMVDQYRIYVPVDRKEEARNLIIEKE